MSLFPAYSAASDSAATQDDSNKQEWLENASFKIDVNVLNPECEATSSKIPDSSDLSNAEDGESRDVSRKHKKKQSESKSKQAKIEPDISEVSDYFHVDKTRTKEFFTVNTISRPSVPMYRRKFYITSKYGRSHQKKFKRYFEVKMKNDDDKSDSEAKITKKDVNSKVCKDVDENFTGFTQEENMSQTTAYYNRNLGEDPTNIEMWLKYVKFQDSVFQFEKTYRKGSIAKGLRVTAERKLSILDKALTHIPNSERLLRERLNVAVSVYPSDELYVQLQKLVEKEQGNIILWQGLIESRQCSMSHCNTPAVLKLYGKCLSTLHQLRRSAKLEKSVLEENILRMLYQCGLFLKQSGLFELLWTLLRLYLELNLSDKDKFDMMSTFHDAQLLELEEVVLNSQLPLHELWLRIEKLRESCHWLPYKGDGNCEDPQRFVFAEDVSELIHPITMPGNTFKLTATILTLLKVPLLPCRHSTMRNLGLDYVPWALDSIEFVLPVFLNMYPIDLTNKHLIQYSQRLAVGPQYLKPLPGQEEYLQFVLQVMQQSMLCLNGVEKTAVCIWWFRFIRILNILEKQEFLKMSNSLKKKMKSDIKALLKNESSNIILYQEYALMEKDLGNFESAVNTLLMMISSQTCNKPIDSIPDVEKQTALCSAFRTLIELHLSNSGLSSNQKTLKYLVALALGKDISIPDDFVTQDVINEAALKFKHVTLLLLQKELHIVPTVQHFLPQFLTDWIICNGWFLFITQGSIECGTFMETTLSTLDEKCPDSIWEKEILFEFYVAVLFKNIQEIRGRGLFKLLDDVLHRSIEKYPNNLFFLSVLAKVQSINCCLGQPFWQVKNLLMKTGHALPNLFLILIANQRNNNIQDNWIDTFTGLHLTMDSGSKNRMVSIFRRLTSPDMCTRRCGLVWRLYLQFLYENFDPKLCRNAYYSAVEECPWLKALYIDAAIYIPAELPQIQDLLIEKQLRLHVTPEELDILRN